MYNNRIKFAHANNRTKANKQYLLPEERIYFTIVETLTQIDGK